MNQEVRRELQKAGLLEKEDRSIRVLTPRSDMTGADRAWAARYEPGDVLQAGAPVYRATDHLGSLSYTLDASGNITGTSAAMPYGQTTINTTGDTFVFTDHERDAENQSDATMYRHFASFQGRWLSPDPTNSSYNPLDPQSLNRYSYVANRPTNTADRFGLDGGTLTFTGGDDDDDDDDDDSGGLSYSGGGSGSGGGSNGFLTDLEDFFSEFSNFFGGGPNNAPSPGGIPSIASATAGLPATTQPNGGQQTIDLNLFYNGKTGVATSSWFMVDSSPGLDTDGMSVIPTSAMAPNKSVGTCLGEALSDGRGAALALDVVGDVALAASISNPASLTALVVGQAASVLGTANSIQHSDWVGSGVGTTNQVVGATGILTHGLEIGGFIRAGTSFAKGLTRIGIFGAVVSTVTDGAQAISAYASCRSTVP